MPYITNHVPKDVALEYEGFTIYHAYDDNEYDKQLDYWYSASPEDNDDDNEFDIRRLSCYDKNMSHEDILKKAIDLKLIHVEV